MTRLVSASAVVGAVCGIGALLLGFVGVPVRLAPPLFAERIYSQVSLHLWFMEMILVILALVVGIFGVLGYQSLKNEARAAAAREARRHFEATRPTPRRADPPEPETREPDSPSPEDTR